MEQPPTGGRRQYSADGRWWWDGQAWQPSTPAEPHGQQTAKRRQTNPVILAVAGLVICFPIGLVFTWLTPWTRKTKAIVSVVTVLGWAVLLTAAAANPPTPRSAPAAVKTSPSVAPRPSPASAGACSTKPDEHVYNPDRLQTLTACVTVTGTIDVVDPEPDGDLHVLLELDPGQTCGSQACLNGKNTSELGGDLLLEPVCEHEVTQADALAACEGYHNSLSIPAVGSHVKVTGRFVLDLNHGWLEIHPLESVTLLSPAPSPTPSPSPSPSPVAAPPPPAALTVNVTASTYGYIAAQTLTGATCTAKARLPSGNYSQAQGLQVSDTAGSDGSLSWTYGTSSRTTKGTGTSFVSCAYNGQTVAASASFTVG